MTALVAFLRSRWAPAALVAVAALVGVGWLSVLLGDAQRGRAAAAALATLKAREALVAQGFLAAVEADRDAVAAQRDALLAREPELAAERARFRKAAGGGRTVAVLDLHSGTVVADGPPGPAGAPSGKGGGPADPSADRGPSSASPPPPSSCSVAKGDPLEFDAPGSVERSPEDVDVYLLKLRVRNTANGWSAAGMVRPDLSKVWTAPPPPPPEEARPGGWMLTALYGRASGGGAAWSGMVHTPPWRVPLLGVPARAAAAGQALPRPDGKGLAAVGMLGVSVELTRWTR